MTLLPGAPKLLDMQIVDRANLSPETYAAVAASLASVVTSVGTLQGIVAWGQQQAPPVLLIDSIAQDEYTHDVIASWREGLILVFGAT